MVSSVPLDVIFGRIVSVHILIFLLLLMIRRGEPPTPSKYLKKEVFDRGSETLDLFLDSLFNGERERRGRERPGWVGEREREIA